MKQETEIEYLKLATHFFETKMKGQDITPKNITDKLKSVAAEYRPAYFRRLRRALSLHQEINGFKKAAARISETVNPVTVKNSNITVKPKQDRVKSVSDSDEKKLIEYFKSVNDDECLAAIYIAQLTGARPSEFKEIIVSENKVSIVGAKKSHEGVRGADRELLFEYPENKQIAVSVKKLKDSNVGAIQDRISRAGKKLWPQRKAVPTLYSWRHQMGSELKASGLSRRQVAYAMGHQATESVNQYGNRRKSKGGFKFKIAEDADLSKVRETHTSADSKRNYRPKKADNSVEKSNLGGLTRKI